jgi:hypothetical protein
MFDIAERSKNAFSTADGTRQGELWNVLTVGLIVSERYSFAAIRRW